MAAANAILKVRNPRLMTFHTPMRVPSNTVVLQISTNGFATGFFMRVSARIYGQARRVSAGEWQRLKLASITTGIQQL